MNETLAIKITPDGEVTTVEWSATDLGPAYRAIGCDQVQMITVDGVHLWMDEDARLRQDRPSVNVRASTLAGIEILGAVLLTPWTNTVDSPGFTPAEADGVIMLLNS